MPGAFDMERQGDLSARKSDHIHMALSARTEGKEERFDYEPLLGHHDLDQIDLSTMFLGRTFSAPLWVSSMTGGSEKARTINARLARACARFGLGMGLGSLRPLLTGKGDFEDFHVRPLLGPDRPLYGNIGIVQVDELLRDKALGQLWEVLEKLQCDGLVVHVNPLQEWYQPEGDFLQRPPLAIIEEFLPECSRPIIVKEVGQGMGPRSLKALMKLPLEALELAGLGGTNFSKLEWERRREEEKRERPQDLTRVGHGALEMIDWINREEEGPNIRCRQFIVSGGVRSFLDGHYLMERLNYPSIYGQASPFLKWALESQRALDNYIESQIAGLKMARSFLRARSFRMGPGRLEDDDSWTV
ncbi:MAG: hypothetical protein OXB88_05695 [Bacteriovoracales bacterium]|nr:hypothetical protein [Bacteriovoracales bacterium]